MPEQVLFRGKACGVSKNLLCLAANLITENGSTFCLIGSLASIRNVAFACRVDSLNVALSTSGSLLDIQAKMSQLTMSLNPTKPIGTWELKPGVAIRSLCEYSGALQISNLKSGNSLSRKVQNIITGGGVGKNSYM